MKPIYNIYCDESCHLLNDHNKTFVLGGIWVEKEKTQTIFQELRDLKESHGLSSTFEAKWTKVSDSKADYYCALVMYFAKNPALHFRGLIVPDKGTLNHSAFYQDHDSWYYKMFWILLNVVIKEGAEYNLYLDIKDTKSNGKVLELKRILNITSVERVSVAHAQQIRSHEVELMQLTDILIGALSYIHRGLDNNNGKKKVLQALETAFGKNELLKTSLKREDKFNILLWKPKT